MSAIARTIADLERENGKFRAALEKVNAIRDSIVGCQCFNWSEHAYPLVAALNDAGFEGQDYPEAKAYVGSLIERAVAAEDEVVKLREALASDRTATTTEEQPREAMAAQIESLKQHITTFRGKAAVYGELLIERAGLREDIEKAVGDMIVWPDSPNDVLNLRDLIGSTRVAKDDLLRRAADIAASVAISALRQAEAAPGVVEAAVKAVCDARIAIYEGKADKADLFADDDCNRYERLKEHAEAIRYLKKELLSALARQPTAPPIEVERTVADGAQGGGQ